MKDITNGEMAQSVHGSGGGGGGGQGQGHSHHGGSHRRRDHDGWEAREALYRRELDEARARAAQMEKTMRWWSDCTANWREKWSKVRTERNRAREEAKLLKAKVDQLTKELAAIKAEMNELQHQVINVKRDNEKLLSIGETRIFSGELLTEDGIELRRKGYVSPEETQAVRQRASLDSHKFSNVDNVLANKLSEMRIRLDEACKNLQTEKDQKTFLLAKVETLTAELHNTKMELTHSDRTIGSNDSSHSEIERLQNELQDEIAAKQVLEEKLAEYRMEVERFKSENTIQWSKRELLETENVAILKENKKLYNQVCELREQIHKLNRISDESYVAYTNRTDKNTLYVQKSSISPHSHGSSNSSEANMTHADTKSNSGDELAIVESNDMGVV